MIAEDTWTPTKFVLNNRGVLRASRDPNEIYVGSRLSADLSAVSLQKKIDQYATGVLVDLGCGKAPLYGVYRRCVNEVICVDWPDSQHETPHIDVYQDLNEPLQLDSASADTVLMTSVLEHIYRPNDLLCEVMRILRPGGRLIMNTPFFYWTHEIPHDYFRYTRFFFEKFSEEHKIPLLSLEEVGGYPEVVIDLLCRASGQAPLIGPLLTEFLRLPLRFYPFGKISEKTKERVTLGYVVVMEKPSE